MVITLIILMIMTLSCSEQLINDFQTKKGLPDQESWGVNIILTNEGVIRAKIASEHLEKYNEKKFISLDNNVVVDFYDNYERHSSTLTSDSAEVNQSANDMVASGNVVAVSDSGISLYTSKLLWDSSEEKLLTKEKIMVTTTDLDTIYGIGFESDSNLENWKIINPSGVTSKDFK